MGGSDGVLKGGSEGGWMMAPRGLSCKLSRSGYSGDGYAWNSVRYSGVKFVGGGVRIFGRGVRNGYGPDICQATYVL